MSFPYLPYCYLIGWSRLNVWYYGSEYGSRSKLANPHNLWRTYYTSSEAVRDFIQQHGDPDIIQVRKIFCTPEATIRWEYKVLQRMRVRRDPRWLNTNDGKAPVGTPWSEARKLSHSVSMSGPHNPNYGRQTPDSVKRKISASHSGRHQGEKNHMYGVQHTEEARRKMSINHARLSGPANPNFGKVWSAQARQAQSASKTPTVFAFVHHEHGTHTATVHEMVTKFQDLKKGGLRALYQGRLLTYKGWVVVGTDESS